MRFANGYVTPLSTYCRACRCHSATQSSVSATSPTRPFFHLQQTSMEVNDMRNVLDSSRIHASVHELISGFHATTIHEVEAAIASNAVVVVGMKGNPFVKKVRRLLDAAGTRFAYLEYGSYLGEWRRRSALKMWTGWPTFPMVFVKGTLIGGANDLKALLDSGELKTMLG